MTTILPYFRTRLRARGYREWTDALNFENIPRTLLDEKFHLQQGSITQISQNQLDLECTAPITVRVFNRAFRDTGSARDVANQVAKDILLDVANPVNAKDQDEIADVQFESYDLVSITDGNDNIFILEISFTVLFHMKPNF